MTRTLETKGATESSAAAGAAIHSSVSPNGTSSGRMAGEDRRRQILQVAMSLFSRRGFRGTTTREIAQAAGVSEAMVFRHFANKEELYSAIIDRKACADNFQQPCDIVPDALARKDDRAVFYGIALAMMRHHEHDTEFLRLLTQSALEGHELADMFWDRNVRRMYDFLGSYIRERQRDGAMRDIDPTIVVRCFLGMVIHHSLNNILWDTRRQLLDIPNERAAEEFTELLLRGIAATPHNPPPAPRSGSPASGVERAKPGGAATAATRTKKKKQ
ncbi:MAG TPA: TetR/AcrR family transcriptional regulator [Pyrinomonadaceae bacterium]|jgi:AcrR family transcriptional regulator|nr:TetR/AcrR family transcriptional regulator [Pyrinomonadaceae bacterium]